MINFVQTALATPELLTESQRLSQQYWQSFNRDASKGRVTTEAGPKVIIPAKVLAIHLFNSLDETLGEVGSHLALYGIGKTWGNFSANHFKEWATTHQISGDVLKFGALYFPMNVGLCPRFDITAVDYQDSKYFVIQIYNSILSELRLQAGLMTEPAHWMISGWLAGCLSSELNQAYEARAVPGSGETSYRVVVALPQDIAQVNLSDSFWLSDISAFQTISIQS